MPELYERKEQEDIAKSRCWLNFLAKKSVENKDLHVVLTLTKSVAFTQEKRKELPTEKHGAGLVFQRRFLRPEKVPLAIKKAKAERKDLKARSKDLKAFIKKIRTTSIQRKSEGNRPDVCHWEYDTEKFTRNAEVYCAKHLEAPVPSQHSYLANKTKALARTPAQIKKRCRKLIELAFRPLTNSDIEKLRKFRTWKENESLRLDARAEFFNHQVDYWKERSSKVVTHRIHVRKYKGHYGEPYYYNRRDVYIPDHAFCDVFRKPFK
ncbi:MAG: hypothetical protein LUC43_07155 [Burkholderiales bacterium]|nr:hypothetical protein [Burkholderiales bacterium]